MPTVQTTLAGANFRPADAKARLKQVVLGEMLGLEADPDNQYDSNAVRVLTDDGHFIGFVAKADNSAVAQALDAGEELYAEVIAFESVLKPVLEINLP